MSLSVTQVCRCPLAYTELAPRIEEAHAQVPRKVEGSETFVLLDPRLTRVHVVDHPAGYVVHLARVSGLKQHPGLIQNRSGAESLRHEQTN